MLGDIAAAEDDDVLAGLVRAAQRDGLWGDVLPVARAMSAAGRARFAKLKPIQTRPVLALDDDVLDGLLAAAEEEGLQDELAALRSLVGD